MKRVYVMFCALAALLALATVAPAQQKATNWLIPWFTGAQGNPYTNAQGVVWSVRTAYPTSTGSHTPLSQFTPMQWTGGSWEQAETMHGYPKSIRCGGEASGWGSYYSHALGTINYNGVRHATLLTFTAPWDGDYSVYGPAKFAHAGGPPDFRVGIYDGATDAWRELYRNASQGNQSWLDLGEIPALKGFRLKAGDRIALFLMSLEGRETYAKELWLHALDATHNPDAATGGVRIGYSPAK